MLFSAIEPSEGQNDILDPFLPEKSTWFMGALQDVLDTIQELTPEEQASLRALLDTDAPSESAFAERMVALGVLERKRRRTPDLDFEPVSTEGQPASQIIIEERR